MIVRANESVRLVESIGGMFAATTISVRVLLSYLYLLLVSWKSVGINVNILTC